MMEQQRERARQAQRGEDAFAWENQVVGLLEGIPPTEFCGYEHCSLTTNIQAVAQDGEMQDRLQDGTGLVVLAETPFYAESGGQVADQGVIIGAEGRFWVEDVQKAADWFVHYGRAEGILIRGEEVRAEVDEEKRLATACNHTATHLLHKALRTVLGDHAQQKGSLVEPERLRFDFSHFAAPTEEELNQIEAIVNQKIWELDEVKVTLTSLDEARKMGATALFGENTGNRFGWSVSEILVWNYVEEPM